MDTAKMKEILKAEYGICDEAEFNAAVSKSVGINLGIALRLIQKFDSEELKKMKNSFVDIAADGIISDDEKPKMEAILQKLDDMVFVINEIKLVGEKALKG